MQQFLDVSPTVSGDVVDVTPTRRKSPSPEQRVNHAVSWRETVASKYASRSAKSSGVKLKYHTRLLHSRLASIVEPGARVLEIGCGQGELLASLKPSVGVGVDIDGEAIRAATQRYPTLRFKKLCGENIKSLADTFDYVIIANVMDDVYDIHALLEAVRNVCHNRSRVILVHEGVFWRTARRIAVSLWPVKKDSVRNLVPLDEVRRLADLAGLETIRSFGLALLPVYVPLLSTIANRFVAHLPLVHRASSQHILVARPVPDEAHPATAVTSVSIVVPARNEAGHIKEIIQRLPIMAPRQELIFVEGGSTDNTWDVIQEAIDSYEGPLVITCMQQDGKGKGDAVRKGFDAATGDVLMILDADISVPPEELPVFVSMLASGRGEFINGTRLIYQMEREAMRFLNFLGNTAFAWVFTYLLSQRFRDTLCGTKVLTRADYQRLAKNRAYFGDFDPFGDFDLLFGAARLNLKIVDVPIHYKSRTYGETNISRFSHGWQLLRMCIFAAKRIKFI